MKFVLKALVVMALLTVAFLMFGPADRVEAFHAKWKTLTGDQGQVCMNLWSKELKDPDSAILLSSYESEGKINIRYKAKNSYGAYVTNRNYCDLRNGKVDDFSVHKQNVAAILKETEQYQN